jgi:hypothetical protein
MICRWLGWSVGRLLIGGVLMLIQGEELLKMGKNLQALDLIVL